VEAWQDTVDPAVRWYVLGASALVLGREAALRARERWREAGEEETHGAEIEELRGEGETSSPGPRMGLRSGERDPV
jgi:hypothetical protein